jgi:ABC-2 type transport system permease protein
VSGIAAARPPAPSAPGVPWLAGHELRLAWRDWRAMVTAGNRRRFSTALVVLAVVALALHIPAYAIVARFGEDGVDPGKTELISVSLIVLLYMSLLLSQAMESVTRSLYSRGDLDLVLSSPVPPRRLFAVRIAANATLIAIMAVVLSAPFVNVLVATGGRRWLAGYGVAVAFGFAMAAIAVAVTIALFRLLGPRRTRLVAQIIAAVVGASFAIGIQVAAILFYSDLAAGILSTPEVLVGVLPDEGSLIWLPARAILGDWLALFWVAIAAVAVVALVTAAVAPRLGEYSIAATDLAAPTGRRRRRHASRFAMRAPARAMRRKEWALLRRDPWLVSQTLTQLLYLLPPALLLARNFGNSTGVVVVVVMVLVTVGGQLAGALAWLAISGEDAPELVATAPVTARAVTRAKVAAVFGAVALVLGPVLAGFALLSWWHALAAVLGILVAAASTVRIQLWFRAQAKRNHFRRRHTSSRIATFGEALVSFSWAAAAGLAAAGSILAAFSAGVALFILLLVRAVSPRKAAPAA